MILGFKKQFVPKILDGSKLHTIREDKHNRWKAGRIINFATGVRTKDYKEFKKGECISVQEIKIIPPKNNNEIRKTFVNGKEVGLKEVALLAKQDGFENFSDFLQWFGNDFSGKIIHWTAYKY